MKTIKYLIIVIFLITIAACATYPPPTIKDRTYINSKYEFSIDLPEGWKQTEKVPEWIKKTIPPQQINRVKIMVFNQESTGFITINAFKTAIDGRNVPDKKIERLLIKNLDNTKKKLWKKPETKDYTYKIHSTSFFNIPMLMCSEDLVVGDEFTELKSKSMSYMYACHNDNSCGVNIVLVSDAKTFDKNYAVFDNLLKSLKKYNYIP